MIRTDRHEQVTVIRIDRHEQRNALDLEHVTGLRGAAEEAVAAGQRAIVVTGEGTSFCSGADLEAVYDKEFREALSQMLQGLANLPVPVIAAVNGPAIGAGVQVAIACDLRISVPTARFAVPTAKLGLAYDPWSVARLQSLAGGGGARALLIGLDTLTAERAHTLGLVDRLGDGVDALAWASELASFAPLTHAYNKLATNAGPGLDPGDERLVDAMWRCYLSEDADEARRARLERRPPSFQGR